MTTSPTAIEEALHRVKRKFEMTPKVAVAGFGNAGKSSLFNAIYGEAKAPVSMRTDETTQTQTEHRFGIAFTDTPGIGTGKFTLEKVSQMAVFDRQHIVIHVLNGTTAISKEDEQLHDLIEMSNARRVTVVNKVDLLDDDERAEYAASVAEKLGLFEGDFLFVSAKRGLHIDLLVRHIADILPEAMQDAFIGQQRADLQLKEKRIRALVYSKATVCAGFAVTPFPIADIAVITPVQITMVAAIGYFHGIPVTRERALELLGILGAGFGLREAARQLVKLIPGAGSVISAGVAFGGTVALGETANLWFKRQMKVPADELRKIFKETAAKARREYDEQAAQRE
jgi:GTP-binding protein Era